MNRRHLTEGQKAVLANEYRKILSKKRQSEAGKKANEVRWHSNNSSDSDTLTESEKNEADPSRKEASNKFKVSVMTNKDPQPIQKYIQLLSFQRYHIQKMKSYYHISYL